MNSPWRLLCLVAGTTFFSNCDQAFAAPRVKRAPGPKSTQKVSTPAKAAAKPAPARSSAATGLPALFGNLTPVPSGFGPVICEPVGQNADDDTVAFGTACGRWLQMAVGGQGELGRTPLWSDIGKAEWEMKRLDLRLDANQAPWMARATGATHVAVGRIEGNSGACTLTYHLLAMPGSTPVGKPLVQSGSRDEVLKALPGMARQLSLLLGVKQPHIPDLAGTTSADFLVIGHAPWAWQEQMPYKDEDKRKLLDLAGRNPLAGLISLYNSVPTAETIQHLMEQAGHNVVVLSAAAEWGQAKMAPYSDQVVDFQYRYPHNYQLAIAHSHVQTTEYSAVDERKQAELAVRCAQDNPNAWIALGTILGVQADATRQSRSVNDMSEAERRKVFEMYPYQEAAHREAARLDPQNSRTWKKLSRAAAFNGDSVLADYSIQKALQLRPDDTENYWWAFQIYQPKWYGDDDKFLKAIELAASNNDVFYQVASDALDALHDNPLSDPRAQTLALRSFARYIPATDTFSASPKTIEVKPPDATLSQSPGIMVCEPVAVQSDDTTAAFGAGCARWLQFTVGGQPELGQTPLWHAIDEARHRLKRADLRLTLAQSATAARWLNASHVAVGKISGNAQQCTLTYQLYAVPPVAHTYVEPLPEDRIKLDDKPAPPKAVGAPLVLTGSKSEVLAQLPGIARQLATRLGVTNSRVPTTIEAKTEDFDALGQVPWLIREPLSAEKAQSLRELAARLPVAALIALSQAVPAKHDASLWQPKRLQVEDQDFLHHDASDLIAKAGDNPLVWGEMAWFAPQEITPVHQQLEDAVKQSPHNFALLSAKAWWLRSQYNFTDAATATWQAVRCNSHYGGAWLEFSDLLGESAQQLQGGLEGSRLFFMMRAILGRVRYLQYQAALMAVRFDPQNSRANLEESKGAARNADPNTAAAAVLYSIALDPDNVDAYAWGFQLVQPSWGTQPQYLWPTLTKILERKDLVEQLAPGIIQAIQTRNNPTDPLQDVLDRARAALDTLSQKQDAATQATLARYFAPQQPDRAKTAFQNWVRLSPDDADAHFEYGSFLYDQQNESIDDAIAQYREAVRLNPNNPNALLFLGTALAYKGGADQEAETVLRRDLQIEPDRAPAHQWLGQALANQHKTDEARAELLTAIADDQSGGMDGATAKASRDVLKSLGN